MVLALSQGSNYGIGAGNRSAWGNVTASVIQALISFFVLFQIGQVTEGILNIIKYAGACYIIYTGIMIFINNDYNQVNDNKPSNNRSGSFFIQGFIFAIVNPKAILFFSALFPRFVDTDSHLLSQLPLLLIPIITIAYLCFMLYVLFGSLIINMFTNNKSIGKILALLMIAAGISMVFL